MILDTDVLSTLVSPRCPVRLAEELLRASGPVYTTAINWAEVCYGIARHPQGQRLRERYQAIIAPALEILDFDAESAEAYGWVRARLEARGEKLNEGDLMIASIALRHQLPLVSGNVRHFRRVPGLQVVNWLEDGAP